MYGWGIGGVLRSPGGGKGGGGDDAVREVGR